MIYIVSGYMRTGTSMMMGALSAGGLEPAFNPRRDAMNAQFGDEEYRPNPGGFYEFSREEFRRFRFPAMYDGKLIKVLCAGLANLAVAEYRVVFMRRDPEEIRQSYEGFFCAEGRPLPGFVRWVLEHYDEYMQESLKVLANRRDVRSATVLWYRDVVREPLAAFEELAEAGWPIEASSAAAVVDPELCRFRREELIEGA